MLSRVMTFAVALLSGFGSLRADTPPADALAARVEQAILSEERLRAYDWVEYRLDEGAVTLEGSASLSTLPESIASLVGRVEGVTSVDNRIESLPYSRDDMAMRVNAYWRIYGNAELRRYAKLDGPIRSRVEREADDAQRVLVKPIHILIRDGHLTLEGEVEQERDAQTAESAANLVMGVRSVVNRLVVVGNNVAEHQALTPGVDPWWTAPDSQSRPTLRIENPGGRVRVEVVETERVRVTKSSYERGVREGDVITDTSGRRTRLRARPEDGARIDLDIELPYGYGLEVETVDGPVELSGLFRHAQVRTAIGAVHLEAPWEIVRLDVEAERRPDLVEAANIEPIAEGRPPHIAPDAKWRLYDSRPRKEVRYGEIQIRATNPKLLRITPGAIPEDSPVRMHWEAPDTLERLFAPERMRALRSREGGGMQARAAATPESPGMPHFSSDVRLVDLTVSAVGYDNAPVTGLTPQDFEIFEEGVRQEVRVVEGEETPFNLVLLLDLSTSTLTERFTLIQAARRFVSVARPDDRVAVHVMSDSYLQVVSPLSADHESVLEKLEDIPALSGSTPLYDAIVLSYAKELTPRRWERNAIIVISDGMDNQILPPVGNLTPSKTPFADLERAAREMEAVIYPIYLDGAESPSTRMTTDRLGWKRQARDQLERLARATGGRLFHAPSFRSLSPVYRQVAEELRSVYRVGYYPNNQDFDGDWREVEVRIHRPGARARTRPGYYAW